MKIRRPSSLIYLIQSDLYRCSGKNDFLSFLKFYLAAKSLKITFWYRLLHHVYSKKNSAFLFILNRFYKCICRRYGIDLPYQTKIGKGLLLHHVNGIVVNPKAIIGENCTISHQVTIGDEKGYSPVIGNKVLLFAGAKLFGNITIGNNVVVGANAVVNKSVPHNSVTIGIPNRIINISYEDSIDRRYV